MTIQVAVLGGAGFIGSHVARKLKSSGSCRVVVSDIWPPAFGNLDLDSICHEFHLMDLRTLSNMRRAVQGCSEVYLFAANMGGMGFLADNDCEVMTDNAVLTANCIRACRDEGTVERVFFASSACVYPQSLQGRSEESRALRLKEEMAWPAEPQDGYGLEKLYGEVEFLKARNAGLHVRIGRYHNVYGPHGTWRDGREKAPAAFIRKIMCGMELSGRDSELPIDISVWGSGEQRRSFCYVDDAVDATIRLMRSSFDEPINIGSEEDLSMNELVERCRVAVQGVELSRQISINIHHVDGPIGVDSRTSCNAKIDRVLGWRPTTTLDEGLLRTATFIHQQLDRLKSSTLAMHGANEWTAFLKSNSESRVVAKETADRPQRIKFAIILPLTTRGVGLQVHLNDFLASFRDTTRDSPNFDFLFLIGIDEDDKLIRSMDLAGTISSHLPLASAHISIRQFNHPPGSVCSIWRDLVMDGYRCGCDFFVMLGDDVELRTFNWPQRVVEEFRAIASLDPSMPMGFGCVAFTDISFPGFPTFPVLHRTHIDIFGELAPASFVNQGLDPFLFQIYRSFGCSRMIKDVQIRNKIGGPQGGRYAKRPVDWNGVLLQGAIERAQEWLNFRGSKTRNLITLDVVVPTYRPSEDALLRILRLESPPTVSTTFIIVFDNPDSQSAWDCFRKLEESCGHNWWVRLRMNERNLGASMTRNRGLEESSADWVLFLDDDVVPEQGIIHAYARAIATHGNAAGFIGPTLLPPPMTPNQRALHVAGIAYFWDIARKFPYAKNLPWGVSANLCTRRTSVRFSDVFPRTGGGEDIDFCIKTRNVMRGMSLQSKDAGFVAVSDAVAHHPYWDSGSPRWNHFAGWARGDGTLTDLYPEFGYWNLPNMAEVSIICPALGIIIQLLVPGSANLSWLFILCPFIFFASDFLSTYAMAEARNRCALTAFYGECIKFVSEMGRIQGHLARGRTIGNLCRRFNWFGEMWLGAVGVERMRAARLWTARLISGAVVFGLLSAVCVR